VKIPNERASKRDEVPLSTMNPLPLIKGKGKKGIGFVSL
jgi:hypothetical protein